MYPTGAATTTAASSSSCDCSCYSLSLEAVDKRRSQVCSNGWIEKDCCSSEDVTVFSMTENVFSPQSTIMQGFAGIGFLTVLYGCVSLVRGKRSTYTQIEFAEQSV